MTTRIIRYPAADKLIEEAATYGLLELGYAAETAWKADVVVRGGHRSFNTDLTKAGTPRVGGTLRRSIHTAAYHNGRQIAAGTARARTSGVDENQEPVPDYVPGTGGRVFVGTNSGYGAFVELGTSKMPPRPAGIPALLSLRGRAPALIAAGARRRLGQ